MRRGVLILVVLLAVIATGAAVWLTRGPGGDSSPVVPDARDEPRERAPRRRIRQVDPPPAAPAEPAVPPALDTLAAPTPKGQPTNVVAGTVLDADTGRPIAGAEVVYRLDHERFWHVASDAEGRFLHHRRPEEERRDVREALHVRAPGYGDWASPSMVPAVEVRLQRQPARPPGQVRGVIAERSGAVVSGRFLVEARNEFGDYEAQYVVADASGAFLMEGVPSGHQWRFNVQGSRSAQTTAVTESCESNVKLVLDNAEGTGLVPLAAAAREVHVHGIPPGEGGAVVRAEVKPRLFWRAEVRDGVARFASLPVGRWDLVLARPGAPDVATQIDVVAGAGPQVVQFASR